MICYSACGNVYSRHQDLELHSEQCSMRVTPPAQLPSMTSVTSVTSMTSMTLPTAQPSGHIMATSSAFFTVPPITATVISTQAPSIIPSPTSQPALISLPTQICQPAPPYLQALQFLSSSSQPSDHNKSDPLLSPGVIPSQPQIIPKPIKRSNSVQSDSVFPPEAVSVDAQTILPMKIKRSDSTNSEQILSPGVMPTQHNQLPMKVERSSSVEYCSSSESPMPQALNFSHQQHPESDAVANFSPSLGIGQFNPMLLTSMSSTADTPHHATGSASNVISINSLYQSVASQAPPPPYITSISAVNSVNNQRLLDHVQNTQLGLKMNDHVQNTQLGLKMNLTVDNSQDSVSSHSLS